MAKKPAKEKTIKAKKPKKASAKKAAPKKASKASLDTPLEVEANGAQASAPLLQILAQYTKDVSFENPNAPDSLRAGLPAPSIELNVEVKGNPREDNTAEVTLLISAKATRDGEVAFICELEYCGLFAFANIPADQMQALVLIECPRLIFPFARKIVSDMTQEGGFPPLMLEPLDFAQLYRQQGGGQVH
jgi:preprotein translocase subunit SecB